MSLANAANDVNDSDHHCNHVSTVHFEKSSIMEHSSTQHVHTECSQCIGIDFSKYKPNAMKLQKDQMTKYLNLHYSSFVSKITTPPPTI